MLLVGKATKALYSLIGTARKYDLPLDIQIELFNTLVVPVLTYGSEIRGDNIIREIELLHMKLMKHVLYVHRYTSTDIADIVYGELGMYPLEITIKCKVINFWSRIIKSLDVYLFIGAIHERDLYVSLVGIY